MEKGFDNILGEEYDQIKKFSPFYGILQKELAKKEGGEADRYDFSPIIFFPNGTKFESGCLTEEGFKSIMKRFIPYSRQGKIDKVTTRSHIGNIACPRAVWVIIWN